MDDRSRQHRHPDGLPRRRALPARAARLDRGAEPPQLAAGGQRRRLDRRDPRRSSRPSATRRARSGSRSATGPRRGFAANYLAPRRRSGDPCRLVRLRRPGRRLAPRPAGARPRGLARGAAGRAGALRRAHHPDRRGRPRDRPLARASAPRRASPTRWCRASPAATPCSSTRRPRRCSRRRGRRRSIAHDWWIYLLVSGAGGTVIYDPEPTVRYRQHGGNLIGGNLGLGAPARRGCGCWRRAGSPNTAT